MIKIENVSIHGFREAIRGMRNPKNSWKKSDSIFLTQEFCDEIEHFDLSVICGGIAPLIKDNDRKLMMQLAAGGPVHAKYRRMITVYLDITAPLYWWKEFDTYKVGTVANSCSSLYEWKLKPFEMDDFSHEHLLGGYMEELERIIQNLNHARLHFLADNLDKDMWWQIIQLLPSSYNQRRTVMLNYEVLSGIYLMRKDHRLDEWREFCMWIEQLPYSEIIVRKEEEA